MPTKIIEQLIKGEYLFQGQAVHIPIKSVIIDVGLAENAGDLIAACGLKGRALIVSDVNTHAVLGAKVEEVLGASGGSLIFQDGVKASIDNVQKIKSAANSCDYIIAIGSGTINDLCKYASFLLHKPYVVFGTAPSMNGFGSANASVTVGGYKKTLKAHLPQGIFLDIDVLSAAPIRLIRSGLGDSICRPTAQADWLLSHFLLGTFYTDLPFDLLKDFEMDLFENSEALVNGDAEIMRLLAGVLVLSGFGMYLAGGSYPASQGEHMIAHTMEMAYGEILPHSYHGEQIGITTLTMAKLQERIINNSGFKIQDSVMPDSFASFLGSDVAKECLIEYKEKQISIEKSGAINQLVSWDNIRSLIFPVMLPYNLLYEALVNAGCPLNPEEIGWNKEQYEGAIYLARFTRNRFTFLDFLPEKRPEGC